MSNVVEVKKREETGTLRMRRMRDAGRVPGILYGHGEESVSISFDTRDVDKMMRAGNFIIEIGGDFSESALIKEVQWDAFGTTVMHIDLARVDAGESVEVSLSVELRGVAPGTRSGGIVKHVTHEVDVRCPANKLPDNLEVSINELNLNDAITAGELELPPAAELLSEPTAIIVTCVPPTVVEEDEDEAEGDSAEPEVIGRKAEDEGDDS